MHKIYKQKGGEILPSWEYHIKVCSYDPLTFISDMLKMNFKIFLRKKKFQFYFFGNIEKQICFLKIFQKVFFRHMDLYFSTAHE